MFPFWSPRHFLGIWVVALALNTVWEMAQTPLYADMAGLAAMDASWRCLRAAFGDALIVVAAYLGAAATARRPFWPLRSRFTAVFLGLAIALSLILEVHAIASGRWAYATSMPRVPGIGIGLAPAAQWLLLPWLTLAIVARWWRRRPEGR